jgi:ABC-type sugar transport system substrate-binding protein
LKALTLILLFTYSTITFAQKVPKVVFLSPDPIDSNNEFWTITHRNLIQAAKDLNIDLEMIYTDSHHSFYIKEVRKLSMRKKKNRPDYFLGLPYKNHEVEILTLLSKANIKVMFTNMALLKEVSDKLGPPRTKYKNWIGLFYPDDYQAGNLIAKEISKKCIENNRIVTITGDHISTASTLRKKGIIDFSENNNLTIKQFIPGLWKKSKVQRIFPHLEKRYPNLCGVLSASDSMAEGVLNSTKKNYHICGVDWTKKGLDLIKKGKFLCSAGGHFLEPSFALVTIFDFHNGIDFKNDIGTSFKTEFHIANSENIDKVLNTFFSHKQILNYKNYSKFYSKKKKYNFKIFE